MYMTWEWGQIGLVFYLGYLLVVGFDGSGKVQQMVFVVGLGMVGKKALLIGLVEVMDYGKLWLCMEMAYRGMGKAVKFG